MIATTNNRPRTAPSVSTCDVSYFNFVFICIGLFYFNHSSHPVKITRLNDSTTMPSPSPTPFSISIGTPTALMPSIPDRYPQHPHHHQPLSRYTAHPVTNPALSNPQAFSAIPFNPGATSRASQPDRYNEMYTSHRAAQRTVMEALDALRSSVRADTAESRALEDLAGENERLNARLEDRERVIAEMYRSAFEAEAPESTLVPLGRIIERCDRELWKRVLREVGEGLQRRRANGEENGRKSGRGVHAVEDGGRSVTAPLVVREVDIPVRRRQV